MIKKISINTIYNLIGSLIPLIFGFLSTPILIQNFGIQNFGILILSWTFIGYFNIFDLGISRSITQFISKKIGENDFDKIPKIFISGLSILLIVGIFFSLIIIISSFFFQSDFNTGLGVEKLKILIRYISIGIPFVLLNSISRGYFEAIQRFDIVNLFRVPIGISIFLIPLITSFYSNDLLISIYLIVLARILFSLIYLFYTFLNYFKIDDINFPEKKITINIIKMSSWLSISSILTPVLSNLDRFFIIYLISSSALTYYSTPNEFLSKILIIPAAAAAVFFPNFAKVTNNIKKSRELLYTGYLSSFIVIIPIILILFSITDFILKVWLGTEFMQESSFLTKVILVGVFFNSIAIIPFSYIQGIGRVDITAKFHLFELPIYIIFLFFMLDFFGIEGAAIAWSSRMILDFILLHNYIGLKEIMKKQAYKLINYYIIIFFISIIFILVAENTLGIFYGFFLSILISLIWFSVLKNKIFTND